MGFLLQQAWFDPRLIHNDNQRTPTTYLNGLHHAGDLWLPEMYLAGGGGRGGGGHGRVGDDNSNDRLAATAINIYGNGSVLYTMRFVDDAKKMSNCLCSLLLSQLLFFIVFPPADAK